MVTNEFWAIFANVEIDRFHFSLSYSEMKCTIVLRMHALIAPLIALYRVKKMVKNGSVVFELNWVEYENCASTRPKLDDIGSFGILAF